MAPGYRSMTTCTAWVRLDNEREISPSEAIVDSQSVKTAALVSEAVGYDAAKQIKGRKRHLTVDTLGKRVACFRKCSQFR